MTGLHKMKGDVLAAHFCAGRIRGAAVFRAAKKRAFGALLLLCMLPVLFAGCGKHECVICGDPAKRTLTVMGKKLYICDPCYRDYIEIQQLYNEILD